MFSDGNLCVSIMDDGRVNATLWISRNGLEHQRCADSGKTASAAPGSGAKQCCTGLRRRNYSE